MGEAAAPTRNYAGLLEACERFGGDRDARMQLFVDAAWDALRNADVSWLGFYMPDPKDCTQMVLGPRRDKPACSPIGLHGACGQSYAERMTLVVTDVANLGEGYVACDPRDLAELVIPVLDDAGEAWGVLDLDSFSRGVFGERDAAELHRALRSAGLTHGGAPAVRII